MYNEKGFNGLLTNNYGARMGYNAKAFSVVLSAGNQTQKESGADNNFQTSYNYLNLNSSLYITKKNKHKREQLCRTRLGS